MVSRARAYNFSTLCPRTYCAPPRATFALTRCLATYKGPAMLTLFANGACGNLNHVNVRWADPQHGTNEANRLGAILAALHQRDIRQADIGTSRDYVVATDSWGIVRRDYKHGESMSAFLKFPVASRDDWERYKAERLDPRNPARTAGNWREIGREWCSKICCTVSCNLAMEIREALPKCSVYIYYMDIRTFGLYEGQYYWESQEKYKVKYIKARIAEVTSDGKRLIVKGEDTLVKRPITIPFDMVVHAIGMDPNVDNMTLSAVFDVKLEKYGHIQKASTYSSMSATSRPGVFVAGAATGPETIDDSVAQGQSAAMAALTLVRSSLLEAAE